MNIFVLSIDPVEAATMLCNKHICKMALESAQLLCSAHPKGIAPYRHTHSNHPCARWTRTSRENYEWLTLHAAAICSEYTQRYDGKRMKTEDVIDWCAANVPVLPTIGLTPFVLAIKEQYRYLIVPDDVVASYRAYYIADKALFAKWVPRATAPSWWPFVDGTLDLKVENKND